jgi:hypothetical protein
MLRFLLSVLRPTIAALLLRLCEPDHGDHRERTEQPHCNTTRSCHSEDRHFVGECAVSNGTSTLQPHANQSFEHATHSIDEALIQCPIPL